MEAPPDEVAAEQLVDPAHRGRGLNELLLGLCEARAAELARARRRRRRRTLAVWAHESDARRLELLERHGYRRERAFLRLERDLDDSLEAPVWPAGITVAAFRPGVDDAAVHAAHEEAFADHYGPAEADLEEWLQSRFAHEDPDLGLWLVAWDGAEVVGGIEAMETPSGAYMGELFVRRPWRGRGIGRALMLEECAELRRARHAPRLLRRRRRQPDRSAAPARVHRLPLVARRHAAVREADRRGLTQAPVGR